MLRLTERQKRILSLVASADAPVTGGAIAQALGISIRTVQAEISRINRICGLIASSNRGYRTTEALTGEQLSLLSPHEDAPLDHTLLKLITNNDGQLTIDDLSERLFVSPPVVERHVRAVRRLVDSYGLRLVKQQGRLHIEGAETEKRRLIGSLITQEAAASLSSLGGLSSYFDDMDISRVKTTVVGSVDRFGYRIKPGYTQNLITSIAIALYRMRLNSHIPDSTATSPNSAAETDIERNITEELFRAYAAHKHINPSIGDIKYVASLFVGQIEPLNAAGNEDVAQTSSRIPSTIKAITEDVFSTFSLHIESEQALYNFSMHVQALIERCESEQLTGTDALETIKLNCPFIYELSLLITKRLCDAFHIEIQESEIGFICIHVGMLVGSAQMTDNKIQVALACDRYQGINARVKEQIEKRFADIASVSEPDDESDSLGKILQADVIITTKQNLATIPQAVLISPFYTSSDHLAVERAINASARRSQSRRMRMLLEPFFSPRLFLKTNEVQNKHDAIRLMGNMLMNQDVVDSSFVELVLQREELSSTCFFDLFAIPHSVEMNARRTMVCLLLSNEGVHWDQSTIHIVLTIAVCQEDRHRFLEIYNTLVKALCNSERVEKLVACNTLDEFLDVLSEQPG